ncbi:Gem-associated protein 5 [Phytophthora citrophthora]|uniref:Gem-associated protein 5 n=1 Tax=Phytophthora citrophthora TaxID=4793 RepID=A0AAD9LE16_9STRA|nr:Gem-associated protein 5 [Phytophthora citrophthora]
MEMTDVLVHGAAVRHSADGCLNSLTGEEYMYVLPPSPNWYCSQICDWGQSEDYGLLVAFGAKNSVFIYQVLSETHTGTRLSFVGQIVRAKRDRRVISVQFLTDVTGELRLICGGEEGSVQIWDVASLTMIEQHKKHKAEVMAVTSSSMLDANFVVAGDRQGRISAWERDAGKVRVFVPISGDGVHSMAISPHDKALVAVGYRSGVLCLIDAVQGTVRHRLSGHDQEVQCVAWKSADDDVTELDVWLASSSRDKTIKVWKVTRNDEPALEQTLRLPTGKQGMSFTQTKQLWLPVAWTTTTARVKHCLWSGSFDGSLLRWEWSADLSEKKGKKRQKCKPVVVKGGHSRMLFSILMAPSVTSGYEDVSMLTVSLDRELRLWKENPPSQSPAATCVETLTGLGGHTYYVSFNAATSVVAAGIGDQTIRLWDLNTKTGSESDYQCDLLWKGLQSKVTCICWHPFQRSVLAYGMEDGRIGIYDTQNKKYNHFHSSHNQEVLQLQWVILKPKSTEGDGFLASIKQLEAAQAEGQSLEDALIAQEGHTTNRDGGDMKISLWSCDAGGNILESSADEVDRKSREVMADSIAFAWDEHCELVAFGRSNGVVEIMEWCGSLNDSMTVHRYHEHLESVSCLAWGKSGNAKLLASGGQKGEIFVYFYGRSSSDERDWSSSEPEIRFLGSIEAHSNKVTCLRWCPNETQSLLASTSADGTAQVWDAISSQRVACFNHHVGRVLSLDWVSPYTLATGGEDQTLRIWDYRNQQKEPSSTMKKHGKVKQPQEVEVIAPEPPADHREGKVAPTSTQTSSSTPSNNSKKKSTRIFHSESKLSPSEIALACCKVAGVDRVEDEKTIGGFLTHTDRKAVQHFFASESKRFQDERGWENLANTLLLQGDIIQALRIVAKEGCLTPTWLSFAPMAGMDVWREMTILYAHQLDSEGNQTAAACHFLSIGKLQSAVSCLVRGGAYKEALALIRSRLGPNDPLLNDTLWKYADYLSKRNRHGEAALALLNIDSVEAKTRAVHMLVNTGDDACIKSALDVLLTSMQCQHKELAFPDSFFISIAGKSLTNARFEVAETAGKLLQSLSGTASHRLTWCLLSVVKVLDEQASAFSFEANDEVKTMKLLQSAAPATVYELFEFLTRERVVGDDDASLYERLVGGKVQDGENYYKQRSKRTDGGFWFELLSACRRCGYWFDIEGDSRIQVAQDLLVEGDCFIDLEKTVGASVDSTVTLAMQVGQRLLRFVIDVMSSSFIGALENLRETYLLLAGASSKECEFRVSVMTVLIPWGFVSPIELPTCGELAEEELDTLVLWSSVLLSQCRIALTTLMPTVESDTCSKQDVELTIRSLLHLLHVRFVAENRGLMDAGNQSQMQELMDEILMAAEKVSDESEKNGDEQATEDRSKKEALIMDVTKLRSRLTWSADEVEQ